MATIKNTPATLVAFGKLLDESVSARDNVENVGAKLSVACYAAIKAKDLDAAEVLAWMQSKDRKLSAERLDDWCMLFSDRYRKAIADIKAVKEDKAITQESAKSRLMAATRAKNACRTAITRALSVGYWLYKIAPEKVEVRTTGAVRITHKDEKLDGAFSMANLTKLGNDAYKRKVMRTANSGTGKMPAPSAGPADAGKSLEAAATYLVGYTSKVTVDVLSADNKKRLQELFVNLCGVFSANEAGEFDATMAEDLYRQTAKTGS